ncbi:MAG TPA: DUF2779 domain-containing protein [Steroidobacteraceae bacterium]|nr:DUF2779 domain-containing protein [Steroidobacteraceae bacterium]
MAASRLSKSRLLSFLQCPKRLWLEAHRPELAQITAARQALFDTGHRVGEVARMLYSRGRQVRVEYTHDLASAPVNAQLSLFPPPGPPAREGGGEGPGRNLVYFEATFEHGGVLIRTDVLEQSAAGTRLVEVKAAAQMKDEYLPDVAIQTWVLEGAGVRVNDVALAHINDQFVYRGGGEYQGLLVEQPMSDLARRVAPRVPEWSGDAAKVIAGPEPATPIGQRCRTPFECPYIHYCWPRTEYPLNVLPKLGPRLDEYVARGYRDVRDVPESEVSGEARVRVWRATLANRAEIAPDLRAQLRGIRYPRFYLDFETISHAIPIWPGTRPYQAIPYQWSVHVEQASGAVEHVEHLDLTGELPARALTQRLLAALGDEGAIVTYSDYERQCLRTLGHLVPMLADRLRALEPRLVDLLPLLRSHYYHPAMRGSWSIKTVLPTVVPHLRYEDLGEVRAGDAAQRAYLEAIDPATTPLRRHDIELALRRYCRFDTEAMLELTRRLSA